MFWPRGCWEWLGCDMEGLDEREPPPPGGVRRLAVAKGPRL
jgi:hypothetical protein